MGRVDVNLADCRLLGDALLDSWLALQPPDMAFPQLLQGWLQRYPPALPDRGESRILRDAARFLERHRLPVFLSLGFLGLPYCYAAVPGVKTLYLSKRFRFQTRERLEETGRFVETALTLGDPLQAQTANRLIQSVRLGHALFRRSVRPGADPAWGEPVNQEDMAGTHLAFSLLVLRGLRIQDRSYSPAEADNWMAAWALIGSRLGLDHGLLPRTQAQAFALATAIEARHFGSCPEGRELAASLAGVMQTAFPGLPVRVLFHLFLGERIGGYLGFDPAPGTGLEKPLLALAGNFPGLLALFRPG